MDLPLDKVSKIASTSLTVIVLRHTTVCVLTKGYIVTEYHMYKNNKLYTRDVT